MNPPAAPADPPATPPPGRSPDARTLASQLHEAQVQWILAELEDERLRSAVASALHDLLGSGATVSDVTERAGVARLARSLVLDVARSPHAAEAVGPLAVAAHHEVGRHEVALGEVVSRESVRAAVAEALTLRGDGRALTERVLASPSAVRVGVRLVGAVVTDVLQQNRALAEKLPGVGGLISFGATLGGGALTRAGQLGKAVVGDSSVERLVGDAVGAGAQATVRRTTAIVHEVVTDEALLAIALELYDAHAEVPVSSLRLTATDEQVTSLAARVQVLVAEAAGSPGAAALVDAGVDAWWEAYADREVAALLADLGLDHDGATDLVLAALAPALGRLRHSGRLEHVVRERTAGFWCSPEVTAVLAGAAAGA